MVVGDKVVVVVDVVVDVVEVDEVVGGVVVVTSIRITGSAAS